MKDKQTGKARGFGFITFVKDSSAELALKLKNHFIRGKWVDCKPAVAKQEISVSTEFSNESVRKWSNSEGYTEELCKNLIDCILEDE